MNKLSLLKEIREVLKETKVNFKGHQFALKVDVNEDPNKKGIKIQFLPTTFGSLSPTEQDDVAIELESILEKGLSDYGMRIERDRELKDKSIIGFFVYIEYIDKIVRSVLQDQGAPESEIPNES